MIADHLTRAGIAVLRYDDRGVGGSTGDTSTATSADFATDALAAVHLLKQRDDIDSSKIGVIGHSEGGIVGPMVAQSGELAFVVIDRPTEPYVHCQPIASAVGQPSFAVVPGLVLCGQAPSDRGCDPHHAC